MPVRAKVYVPIGYSADQVTKHGTSHGGLFWSATAWRLLALNLSILSVCGAAFTGVLSVLCAMSTDTKGMIDTLLEERWVVESSVPVWVGEIGGVHGLLEDTPTNDFFKSVLRGDSTVRNSWWYNFISGYLRQTDLDWGYWAFNGDWLMEDTPTSAYSESPEGLATMDYSGLRFEAQMRSLGLLMDSPASVETRLPLRASAGWIVDTNGDRVKLSCVNWFGGHQHKFAPGGLNHQPLPALAQLIASMGFNCVRLTFSLELVLVNPVVDSPEFQEHNAALMGKRALEVFDHTIAELSRVGVMTILNNHNSESGWCCDIDSAEGMWDTPAYPAQRWVEAWELLARRYANDSFVIGADLRNEIHDVGERVITWGSSTDPSSDWKAAVELVSSKIDSYAPEWLIFVSGLCFTFDLRLQDPIKGGVMPSMPRMDKLVWTVHFYPMSMWWQRVESEIVLLGYLIRTVCAVLAICLLLTSCGVFGGVKRIWRRVVLWSSTACALAAAFIASMEISFANLVGMLMCLCITFVGLSVVTIAWTNDVSGCRGYRFVDCAFTAALWGVFVGVGILVLDMLFKTVYTQVGCMAVYNAFYDYSLAAYLTLTTASIVTLILLAVLVYLAVQTYE